MITNPTQTKIKLLKGVNMLADTVKVTLGTKGRLVVYTDYYHFDDQQGRPVLTKDGVTVAKNVKSDDPVEEQAIRIVKEAAKNTVDSSGDGTTSTIVLSQYLINKGYKLLEENFSSYQINKEFDEALEDIVEYIESKSIHVHKDLNKLKELASISANDKEIGEIIFDIIEELGTEADIEVKKSKRSSTIIEAVSGMKLHKGYFAPFMCNDYVNMTFEAKDVNIFIYDGVIRSYSDIEPYVKASVDSNGIPTPLLVYAKDVSKVALTRIEGSMKYHPRPLMIVEHDGFGDRRLDLINDLSAITGAEIISEEGRATISNPSVSLGFCEEVIVNQNFSSFIGGHGSREVVEAAVEEIKAKLKVAEYEKDIRYYNKRIANLISGIAVIHVGGSTPFEMEETYMRMEDAVLAVKAAVKSGVSIGGGFTWENAAVRADANIRGYNRADNPAYYLVYEALEEILKQLLKNSGEYTSDFFKKVKEEYTSTTPKAYNLIDRKFYDIDDYKVFDATSVLIDSITNACSVAKSILSIEKSIHFSNPSVQ